MTDFFNSVGMEYVVIGLAAALFLALILVIVALVKVGKNDMKSFYLGKMENR